MNISMSFIEFFVDNARIAVWLEVQNNEYILYEVSDV